MLEVIKPGLETSVQDYPGRIGFWNQGFPPSGPMDSWSFRLANVLVGNEAGRGGPGMPVRRPDAEVPARRGDRGHRRRHAAQARRRADPDVAEHRGQGRTDPGADLRQDRRARATSRSRAASTRRPGSARARPSTRRAWAAWTVTRSRRARWSRSPRPKASPAGGSRTRRSPPIVDRQALDDRGGGGPERRLDRRGGPRAVPRRRLEALGQERPHRLPPRGAGMDLHREGLQQVPRARRRALQHHRPGLSARRHQPRRPDPDHPGQRRPEHGRLHQSLHRAVCARSGSSASPSPARSTGSEP